MYDDLENGASPVESTLVQQGVDQVGVNSDRYTHTHRYTDRYTYRQVTDRYTQRQVCTD